MEGQVPTLLAVLGVALSCVGAGSLLAAWRLNSGRIGELRLANAELRRDLERAQAETRDASEERDRAKLTDRARSHFLAQMNHDLRTPLNAILGYAMLLTEDAEAAGNKAAVADLERIRKASQHLLTLLEDLVQLSEIEDSPGPRATTIVDVEEMVATLAPTGDEYGRTLEATVDRDAALLLCDRDKAVHCLRSLIRWFGADDAPLSLHASVETGPATNAHILFRLTDAASPAETPRNDANSTKPTADNSAEWHVRAQRIAAAMGGTIVCRMATEAPAEATLSLPLRGFRRDKRRIRSEFGGSVETDGERPSINDRPTALVIDDHCASRELMQRWLTRNNFQVLVASDGDEGLRLARECDPALIVLDIHMPGRSGHEVLRALRECERTRETPVIVVTVDDDRARILDGGASEFIRKPASESQIRDIVELYGKPAAGEVLIIDDDADFADLVGRYARQVGLAVRHAVDGEDGITSLRAKRPSAVVLDLRMPKANGFAVLDFLRKNSELQDTPVIVMTAGEIAIEDYRRLCDAGCRVTSKGLWSPRQIAAQLKDMAA